MASGSVSLPSQTDTRQFLRSNGSHKLCPLTRVEVTTVRSGRTAFRTRYYISSMATKDVASIAQGVRAPGAL